MKPLVINAAAARATLKNGHRPSMIQSFARDLAAVVSTCTLLKNIRRETGVRSHRTTHCLMPGVASGRRYAERYAIIDRWVKCINQKVTKKKDLNIQLFVP